MPVRRLPVLLVLVLAGAQTLSAYTLVRKGGRRMEIRDAPRYQDGTAYFTFKNGLYGFLPEDEVDLAATERANGRRPSRKDKKAMAPKAPEPPKVYTNDDLASAVGLANVEGTVVADGLPEAAPSPVPPGLPTGAPAPLPPAAGRPPPIP